MISHKRVGQRACRNNRITMREKEAAPLDISMVYRIAGLGIIIAILNIVLSQAGRQEQAQMLSLAGVIIVLVWLVQMIADLFSNVETVFQLWH